MSILLLCCIDSLLPNGWPCLKSCIANPWSFTTSCMGLHTRIWWPDIYIWWLPFIKFYLLAPFLNKWPLKQVFRGHSSPRLRAVSLFSSVSYTCERTSSVKRQSCKTQEMRVAAREEKECLSFFMPSPSHTFSHACVHSRAFHSTNYEKWGTACSLL